MDAKQYRQNRVHRLGEHEHLLIEAETIPEILDCISTLKDDGCFARRKMYQIVQAFKSGDTHTANHLIAKLSELRQESASTLLNLQAMFGNNNAHWLHLIDLWDYVPQK